MKRMVLLAIAFIMPVAGSNASEGMLMASTLAVIQSGDSRLTQENADLRDRFYPLLMRSRDLCSDIPSVSETTEIIITDWKKIKSVTPLDLATNMIAVASKTVALNRFLPVPCKKIWSKYTFMRMMGQTESDIRMTLPKLAIAYINAGLETWPN